MENILNNAWTITIGGTVVASIIVYHVFGIGKTNDKKTQLPKELSTKLLSKELSTKLTPRKIIEAVGKQPLSQKKTAEDSYIGITVKDWSVTIAAVEKKQRGIFRVSMIDSKGGYPWIYSEVKQKDYPHLGIAHEGDKLFVDGKISKVEGHQIYLQNAILRLDHSE